MAYRMVYLRINSHGYSSGWASDAERDAFKSESRRIFQNMGWTLREGRNGTCDTVTQGHQDLYLHPTSFILGQYRTKKTSLYIVDSVADYVAEQFEIRRLCDRDRQNGIGKRFVSGLITQLLQEGRLITAETSHGQGIRTATTKEMKVYRQAAEPINGQITMTL